MTPRAMARFWTMIRRAAREELHRVGQLREIVAHQHHVRCFERDIRSSSPHRNANVSRCQRWGIVDAVSDDCDAQAGRLQLTDDGNFVLWEKSSSPLVETHLASDRPRCAFVVARQHDQTAQTKPAELVYDISSHRTHDIGNAEHREHTSIHHCVDCSSGTLAKFRRCVSQARGDRHSMLFEQKLIPHEDGRASKLGPNPTTRQGRQRLNAVDEGTVESADRLRMCHNGEAKRVFRAILHRRDEPQRLNRVNAFGWHNLCEAWLANGERPGLVEDNCIHDTNRFQLKRP